MFPALAEESTDGGYKIQISWQGGRTTSVTLHTIQTSRNISALQRLVNLAHGGHADINPKAGVQSNLFAEL